MSGIGASSGSSLASTSCNVANDSTPPSDEDLSYPLWKFVAKGERTPGGGGNYSFKCNFCGLTKHGSYTRVRAHLLRLSGKGIIICEKVSDEDIQRMKKYEREAESYKES